MTPTLADNHSSTLPIPKKIHYVWVGGAEPPAMMQKCMESWAKILPEYELICWDEKRFDMNSVPFVKEAYEARRFAFVSDYLRLYALYTEGGIYMDTDVEVFKPLDPFLKHDFFSGFESKNFVPTGLMGAKKGNVWMKELLDWYENRHFIKENGELEIVPNTVMMTESAVKNGLALNNAYQELPNGCVFYPQEYFCPKDKYNEPRLTPNSFAIHYFMGSWGDKNLLFWSCRALRFCLGSYLGSRASLLLGYLCTHGFSQTFQKVSSNIKDKFLNK